MAEAGSQYRAFGVEVVSPTIVTEYLVRAVARNGNLLLDVGPDANGVFDPQAVKVLKEIGAWLKVNGEAIYSLTESSFVSPQLYSK